MYSDLCKGRISLAHQCYLVTTVTADRHPWFEDIRIARIVIREMSVLQHQRQVTSLAFVLMPDHLHWLFQLRPRQSISSIMRSLKGRSTAEIRALTGERERVWQRGFHDHAVRREEDLVSVARYIVANPIRAGLVQDIGKYPFWDAMWLEWSREFWPG